jgi:DNA-binding MarR family transcriptional regulator
MPHEKGLRRVKDQAQSLEFDLGEYLPFQMSVIAGSVFHRVMEDAGLQIPEWRIMMALPANQPCSSHDLCILTAMDAARVSRAQRRLEDLQLISVIRDKVDRRRLVVRLSAKGIEEVLRLRTAARDAESDLLDALGPEDRAQLKTALGNIYEQLTD